jgi:hypothetical protein
MYRRIFKGQRRKQSKADSSVFSCLSLHKNPVLSTPGMLTVAAIDIGTINPCIRVERRYVEDGSLIKVETLIQHLFNPSLNPERHYMLEIVDVIDSLLYIFTECQFILIESQIGFSVEMSRCQQHITTYILSTVRDRGVNPQVVEIDSLVKSRVLGSPTFKKKSDLKKWCEVEAFRLLKSRGEDEVVEHIMRGKRDDHCDVVCFTEAWWMILNGQSKYTTQYNLGDLLRGT